MGCGCGKKKTPTGGNKVVKSTTTGKKSVGVRKTRRIIRRTPKQ